MKTKLTKTVFNSLPTDAYLVSNVGNAPGQPLFAELIAQPAQRADQWRRIVQKRANGRAYSVYESPRKFMERSLAGRSDRQRN